MTITTTQLDIPNFRDFSWNTVQAGSEREITFARQIQALKDARELNGTQHLKEDKNRLL
jgi:hypothetical protein